MDDYQRVNMYDLVLASSVDKSKYKIYDTLWAYKIKFKTGGLTFEKLNPRWCLRGGSMDRDLYKSYAEMMRATSMNIMWGLKSAFYHKLVAGLFDQSDAFQATATVGKDGKLLKGEEELYCRQATPPHAAVLEEERLLPWNRRTGAHARGTAPAVEPASSCGCTRFTGGYTWQVVRIRPRACT